MKCSRYDRVCLNETFCRFRGHCAALTLGGIAQHPELMQLNNDVRRICDRLEALEKQMAGNQERLSVGFKPPTFEQQARDMLERAGVPDAQDYSSGDLVEIANMLAELARLRMGSG